MANTYASLLYHIVFSTKFRARCLASHVRHELWPYLGGIARKDGLIAFEIGGYLDHAHLLLSIPPRIAVADAVRLLKGGSTPWIKSRFPKTGAFAWQDGYSAFSVGESEASHVRAYIRGQEEHQRTIPFAEECRILLRQHHVAFDERYVLG